MFAASTRSKRTNRPTETVEPLSKKLGIPIDRFELDLLVFGDPGLPSRRYLLAKLSEN
jgi:hypothetical protein